MWFEIYIRALWQVMLDLSPSLLLGLLIAGLMRVYLPKGLVHRGLNRSDMRSAARASLIGVPLPLCSCRVIPTALGLGFDSLLTGVQRPVEPHFHGTDWIATGSAMLLSGLLVYLVVLRLKARIQVRQTPAQGAGLMLKVEGMSCPHCLSSVKKTLENEDTVIEATPDLSSGLVRVSGDHLDVTALLLAVEKAGFRASETREA